MFSLTEFSPLSIIPRDHILIVHKGFFDGGNQADSTQYDIVTLAAFSGSEIQWRNFDAKWNAKLTKHGAPWLHTTDAIGLTKDFSKRKGWDEDKVQRLIEDCVSVIATCSAVRKGRQITHAGIRPASISVLLKDFKRALLKIPDLGSAEHICATQCTGFCLHYGLHIGAVKFQLFFDRNEPFCGHIQDRVNNRQAKKLDPLWNHVVFVGEGDMRDIPGLQAADLLAWSINHDHEENGPRYEWQRRLLMIDRDKELFDFSKLSKPQRQVIDLVKTWKLPRRKPTR
jgi:hypothetical protein